MPKAVVKPGMIHRVPHPDGGLGTRVAEGSIIQVTPDELRAFSDKLELYVPPIADRPEGPLLGDDEEFIVEVIEATDAAKALAEEYEVDLADILGSGDGGRILKKDVAAYVSLE